MAWTGPRLTTLSAVVGAVATAVGAGLVFWQIHSAASALYSGNSYTAQKDIFEAADRLLEARDWLRSQGADKSKEKLLRANQARLAIHLDSLVDAVAGLRANRGIKEETWAHILWWMCPAFSKESFKLDETLLGSTQDACTQNSDLWKVKPQ